jgi:hypothetical protein
VPFADYNLNRNFVIEAHGFQSNNINPTNQGENAILRVITFHGVSGVAPARASFSFSTLPIWLGSRHR